MKLKRIFFAALAVAVSSTQVSFGQIFTSLNEETNTINNLTTANLKGAVDTVRVQSYYASEENGKIVKGNKDDSDFYIYNPDGSAFFCNEVIETNDKGMVSATCKYSWGDLQSKTVFVYDANNKCVGKKIYNAKNTLLATAKCVTDAAGNIIRDIWTTTNAAENNIKNYTSIFVYTYSPEGIRTSFANKETSGEVYMSYKYELDENKNPIKEIIWDADAGESTTTYKYTKFDDKGNWTECIKDKGYDKSIIEREISYIK